MMKDIIKKIEDLCKMIEIDSKYSRNIEDLIQEHALKISTEVTNIIVNSEIINTDYDFVFLGYEALSEEDIQFEYKNKSNRMSFFGAYDYKSNLILKEDMYIYFEDSIDDELEIPDAIKDISVLFPLFKFQGDYIVVDMRDSSFGNLVTIIDGHIASILAPSIKDHLVDLLEGINEGHYNVMDDEVIYPSSWHLRKKVRLGKLRMDEYGECY